MLNTIQSTLYSHNKARKRKIAKRSKMGKVPPFFLASFQEGEGILAISGVLLIDYLAICDRTTYMKIRMNSCKPT